MDKSLERSLAKLKNRDYEEFSNLRDLGFDGERYKFLAFLGLHLITLSLVLLAIYLAGPAGSNSLQVYLCVSAVGVLYPVSYVITAGIATVCRLDKLFKRIFEHFSHKTLAFERFEELKEIFEPIELAVEKRVIDILTPLAEQVEKRLAENRDLNDYLRLKRKREYYLSDINRVRTNCHLNDEVLSTVNEYIDYIRFDSSQRTKFQSLRRRIENQKQGFYNFLVGLNYEPKKLAQNTSSPLHELLPSPPTSAKPRGLRQFLKRNASERLTKKNQNERRSTSLSILPESDSPSHQTNRTKKATIFTSLPKEKSINQRLNPIGVSDGGSHPVVTSDDERETPLINSSLQLPPKKKLSSYTRTFVATRELRLQIAAKQLDVGSRGELMVLESERQKLSSLGENGMLVEHSSVTIGDGLGYDIKSYRNGRPIYIEVKTTTGSFWANLYFTRNELMKMRSLDEKYFLFRLWNFNMSDNTCHLNVFEGREMIESHFRFRPNLFILDPKDSN